MKYPIVIHKDKHSDYGVTVPDLPGCFSVGSSFEDALDMAAEAIETHLEGMIKDGEPIPSSTSIESHQNNPDFENGIWALVTIDVGKLNVKTKRINITMPENVIISADEYAKKNQISRSYLLTRAVTHYISDKD